ncbi:MAG: 3-oxoadipate enol-lactonase [Albidovulum sp.]|nr:3-oxoadipate enol-lactonase [Albidovulum sp.]MDE0303965.1 3-oxoadipate enol-lactonase [Albidovulum sp.]MDE0532473.1 3-oxoadipate enol-lactonase [Albidovulum sp.]
MTIIDLGKITLNTCVDGTEGNPWIVLSNSLGANLSMWEPQIATLSAKYRILRYDTRGHGKSSTPEGPYSLSDLVGDAIALMDRMKIENASWMGLSMGAMTGMGLALEHGDRFKRMVLADARADAPASFRNMWDERIAKIENGGTEAIADGTLGTWLTSEFRKVKPKTSEWLRAMIVATDDRGYIACARGLKNLNYLFRLGEVALPVLYVGGSDDPGAPPTVMREMADATPGASYVEIPNAAHIANVNKPDEFNRAIASFLGV